MHYAMQTPNACLIIHTNCGWVNSSRDITKGMDDELLDGKQVSTDISVPVQCSAVHTHWLAMSKLAGFDFSIKRNWKYCWVCVCVLFIFDLIFLYVCSKVCVSQSSIGRMKNETYDKINYFWAHFNSCSQNAVRKQARFKHVLMWVFNLPYEDHQSFYTLSQMHRHTAYHL